MKILIRINKSFAGRSRMGFRRFIYRVIEEHLKTEVLTPDINKVTIVILFDDIMEFYYDNKGADLETWRSRLIG